MWLISLRKHPLLMFALAMQCVSDLFLRNNTALHMNNGEMLDTMHRKYLCAMCILLRHYIPLKIAVNANTTNHNNNEELREAHIKSTDKSYNLIFKWIQFANRQFVNSKHTYSQCQCPCLYPCQRKRLRVCMSV